MKKVLVVANGGREHAICEALKRSPQRPRVVVFGSAKNPGINMLADDYRVGDILNPEEVAEYGVEQGVDFAIVGPEAPIAAGVVDALLERDIHSVAPLQKLAQIESSKSFTRALIEKYEIPANPGYQRFESETGMQEFAESYNGNFVVKADGLRGGKGVLVAGDHFTTIEEGLTVAKKFMATDGAVVLEEKLVGQEFSLMFFVDGVNCSPMPCVQDHKRAYEGDKGPNTGGMGSYSDVDHLLPFLTPADVEKATEITEAVTQAIYDQTGEKFKGILFGGFMATADDVKLIEYNARFGDPESMNVLSILETDFVEVCEAIMYDGLADLEIKFKNQATVCKYIVPEGYPTNSVKGEEVVVGQMPIGVEIYYAAVDEKDGKKIMTGSRAIGVVGVGDTIEAAESLAQQGVEQITGPVFYRKDIGTSDLIASRVEMLKELRKK